MDDAKARQLFEKIAAHPQIKELIGAEIEDQAKKFRKETGQRIWDRAQRQLARQHGLNTIADLRRVLKEAGYPQKHSAGYLQGEVADG